MFASSHSPPSARGSSPRARGTKISLEELTQRSGESLDTTSDCAPQDTADQQLALWDSSADVEVRHVRA
jgi:hypothetical protein